MNLTPAAVKQVLCAGDSITRGFSQQFLVLPYYAEWPGGYRAYLQAIARSENKRIQFMGSQTTNSDGMSNPQHEGVSGEIITQIQARVVALPATPAPDVVILHAGTNDFYYWVASGTPAISAVQTRHTAMINAVFAKWPSTKIIVTTLGSWYNITGTADGVIFNTMNGLSEKASYNSYIAGLPGTHVNGANIKVCDLASLFTASGYYGDGLHPKKEGYQFMAWKIWGTLGPLV